MRARTTSSSGRPSSTAICTYFCGGMRADVNRRRVVPAEERLVALAVLVQPLQRLGRALRRRRSPCVCGSAGRCPRSSACRRGRTSDRSVGSSTSVAQVWSTPRGANISLNFADSSAVRSFGFSWPGIVELFRLLLRVEVVEIAEPLVEAMHGRQELVAVAQVVLAELRRSRSPAS